MSLTGIKFLPDVCVPSPRLHSYIPTHASSVSRLCMVLAVRSETTAGVFLESDSKDLILGRFGRISKFAKMGFIEMIQVKACGPNSRWGVLTVILSRRNLSDLPHEY